MDNLLHNHVDSPSPKSLTIFRDCGKTFKLTRNRQEKNKHILAVKAENMKKHGSGCLRDNGNALVKKHRGQYVQLGHFLAPMGAQGVRMPDMSLDCGSRDAWWP